MKLYLVGGWTNPSEKYARQIGSFSHIGVKMKSIWNQHLDINWNIAPALLKPKNTY